MASEAPRDEKIRTIRLAVDIAALVDLVHWLDDIAGRPSLDSSATPKIDENASIDALHLSTRVRNGLLRNGINTVRALVASVEDIQNLPRMGIGTELEVKERLRAVGVLPGGTPLPTVAIQRGYRHASVFIDGTASKHEVSLQTVTAASACIRNMLGDGVRLKLDQRVWHVQKVPLVRADDLARQLAVLWRTDYGASLIAG